MRAIMEAAASQLTNSAEGIMYSATGEFYVAEALVSARSSLRHNRVPHVLFASPVPELTEADAGLVVQPFEPSGDAYIDKIANIRRSPFKRTIFLDSDTYVIGEIAHTLRLLSHYDVAAAYTQGYRSMQDPEVPAAFYELNTGVIVWRASKLVAAFLAGWQEIFEAWQQDEPFRKAGGNDQPAFRRAAWQHGLRLLALGPEYNCRTIVPQTVVDRVRVIHGRYHDYEALAEQLNGRRGPRSFQPAGLTKLPFVGQESRPAGSRSAGFVEEITEAETPALRHFFVSGFARSGTTALAFMLNQHPQIVLGVERFKRIMAWLDPAHFDPDIFFNPIAAETDVSAASLYQRLRAKFEAGGVHLIGDKEPRYVRHLAAIASRFPDATFVVTFREPSAVAASYQRRASDPEDRVWGRRRDARVALAEYNETLRLVRDFGEAGNRERVFILPYEPFYGGEEIWLEALFAFLDLPLPASMRAYYRELVSEAKQRSESAFELGAEMLKQIEQGVDPKALGWWRGRMEEELSAVLTPGEISETPVEVPALEESHLAEWRSERDRILETMFNGADGRPDHADVLRKRIEQLGGALVRRADELASREAALKAEAARRSAAESAVARAAITEARGPQSGAGRARAGRFRLTFVLPHQRRTTGGIYSMEQYARCLRSTMEVHLAVQETTPTALRGTTAGWALDIDDLPDADALVMPAETPDAWLLDAPARKGRVILYLQGFNTPGSPQTPANLERFGDPASPREVGADPDPNVIAVSQWAATEAALLGCRVAYIPVGLDRSVFAPGPATATRRPIVAMMTHEAEWKGAEDGLRALTLIKEERPDVELILFGTAAPEIQCEYYEAPRREAVAKLLQRACVYVVPSWEEGYGMTGVEALACGAALATTDTKGSRDYAWDARTALVSPPRDPEALARNALRLLEDQSLRSKLFSGAEAMLAERIPTWEESAERFAEAVMGAVSQPVMEAAQTGV